MKSLLRSLQIQHYKSLDNVYVTLEPGVTIVVGPNAVGKSNFVDAMRFARDAVREDLDHAITQHGGIARVRQWSRTRPYNVFLGFTFDQEIEAKQLSADYQFTVKSLASGNFEVDWEKASWSAKELRLNAPANSTSLDLVHLIVSHELQRDQSGKVLLDGEFESQRVSDDQLALRAHAPPLANFISSWSFATLYPNRLKDPSIPVTDRELKEDGSNWASVIRAMKRTTDGRMAFDKIREAMQAVIPSFKDVSVSSVGSYLVPWFTFDVKGETLKFDPVQLSDGTLRIFGILLALYQNPPPPLLVIEEPEQTVHPGVLSVLADAFKEAAERTQIIITTHSPHLVDCFQPHELRVVSLQDGLTQIRPLKATQVEAVKRNLMSLEEFMLAEGLQGET